MVIIQRKALALLVALGIALGVVGLLLSGSGPVAAQASPSATRTLPQSAVAPGSEFNVTVALSGTNLGSIKETLPAGFSYVEGSEAPALFVSATTTGQVATGQVVTFTLVNSNSVTYRVTASDVEGPHSFSGTFRQLADGATPIDIGGDSSVTVEASAPPPGNGSGNGGGGADPSASRSVSPMSVDRGGQAVVTIDVSNTSFGQVVETLPMGLSFVAGSVSPSSVGVAKTGQDVTFTLVGQGHSSFSYTVMAGDRTGDQTIMGVLKIVDGATSQVTDYPMDDTTITVTGVDPSASRSISPSPVDPGAEATVTIDVVGTSVGQIVETLPEGFGYVANSVSPSDVGVEMTAGSQDVTFTLVGHSTFSYRVMTPEMEQNYTFMGVLKVLDTATSQTMDYPMDDTNLLVGIPTPTPSPSPTATPVVDDQGTPVPPTRTPRPTPVPPPPPTPVAIEKADVTAVEGAMTVQPDGSATVSSADGMATVMLPSTSRARTYQVMVSSDMAGCSGAPATVQACATVTSYDAEGNMESGVMLIRRATVVMMLDSAAVEELGGLPTVFQANALGAFSVYQGDGDAWGARRFSMGLAEDGGVAVTVTGLRTLGSVALSVNEDALTQAKLQTGVITPTPVPTPAAPTPEPTATPEPEPTPMAEGEKPPVGDTTLPVGLLVVLALTGALMVYTGSRVMRRRPVSR